MKIGIVVTGKKADSLVTQLKTLGLNYYFQVLKSKNDYISEGIFDSDLIFLVTGDNYQEYRSEIKRLNTCFCICFVIGDGKTIKKDLRRASFFHIEDKLQVERIIGKAIYHLSVGLLCAQSSLWSIELGELKKVLKEENSFQYEEVYKTETRAEYLASRIRNSSWYKDKRRPNVYISFVGGVTLNDIAIFSDNITAKSENFPLISISLATPNGESYSNEYSALIVVSYD